MAQKQMDFQRQMSNTAVQRRMADEMHSFLNFAENPDNLPQMEEWGLAVKNERLAQALQAEADEKTTQYIHYVNLR